MNTSKFSIQNEIEKLTTSVSHPYTIALFRKCLYLFVFFNTLVLLTAASEFWGPNAQTQTYYTYNTITIKIFNLLANRYFKNYYLFFVYGLLASIIISFFTKQQRALSFIIYFFAFTLYNRALTIQNGGTNLVIILLFYNLFLNENASKNHESKYSIVDTLLSNLSFSMIRIQILIVYAIAGFYKLTGMHWIDGTALYYVLQIDQFTNPFARTYMLTNDFIIYAGTYFTLGVQLLFPFMVNFSLTRRWIILAGTILHLVIVFVVGLPDFGFAMIAVYTIFYTNDESKKYIYILPEKMRSIFTKSISK